MSLEADVHNVRQFLQTFKGLANITQALEGALAAEGKAKSAEKRADAAQALATHTAAEVLAMTASVDAAKQEAIKLVADAKNEASRIRAEAKAKAETTVAASIQKAAIVDRQAALDAEKFAAQSQTNKEVLDMLGAQIAHAEAKLSEIRAAIAALTKA